MCARRQKQSNYGVYADGEFIETCDLQSVSKVYKSYTELKAQNEKLTKVNKELTKIVEEQKAYITELEYAPNGVGYQKAKDEFDELAKQ